MSTSIALEKTDFIKFNVSPAFKKIVAKQAKKAGLTLSELGRMLFGWYAHGLIRPPTLEDMAKKALRNYEKGRGVTLSSSKDIKKFLDTL